MQSYFLENGARRNIKIPSFSTAIERNGAQFYIEYGGFKWECQFQKSCGGGVHPSWHFGQNIRAPNTTTYENLIDFYAKNLRSRDNYSTHHAHQKYWRIEVFNKNICVFSMVGEISDYIVLKHVFDLKTVKQQHPNLLLTDVLDISITIGRRDVFGSFSLTALQVVPDQTPNESLKVMLDKGILTDVVIRTAEKEFPCHKVVLASSSEVFRAMFESEMSESSNGVVALDQFDAATVHDLLYYLYTKKAPPTVNETCKGLFVAADYFQITVLKEICTETLYTVISIENAAGIVELAETFNVQVLKKRAVQFIAENFHEVVSTPEWNSIPDQMAKKLLTTFLSIISQNKLCKY